MVTFSLRCLSFLEGTSSQLLVTDRGFQIRKVFSQQQFPDRWQTSFLMYKEAAINIKCSQIAMACCNKVIINKHALLWFVPFKTLFVLFNTLMAGADFVIAAIILFFFYIYIYKRSERCCFFFCCFFLAFYCFQEHFCRQPCPPFYYTTMTKKNQQSSKQICCCFETFLWNSFLGEGLIFCSIHDSSRDIAVVYPERCCLPLIWSNHTCLGFDMPPRPVFKLE